MDQYKEFLLQTLDLIGFQQNREQWVKEFMEYSQQQAFLVLLKTLPQDQQTTLSNELQYPPNGKTPEQVLQQYFTPLDCSIALQEQMWEEYKKFVQNTMNTLPPEKQKALQDFLIPLVNSVH